MGLEFGLRIQRVAQTALRVEHEVNVMSGGLGTVPQKTDGVLSVGGADIAFYVCDPLRRIATTRASRLAQSETLRS